MKKKQIELELEKARGLLAGIRRLCLNLDEPEPQKLVYIQEAIDESGLLPCEVLCLNSSPKPTSEN